MSEKFNLLIFNDFIILSPTKLQISNAKPKLSNAKHDLSDELDFC